MFQGLQSRPLAPVRRFLVVIAIVGAGLSGASPNAAGQQSVATTSRPAADLSRRSVADAEADARAKETEQKMTDDERFTLVISLLGPVPSLGVPRDKRIRESM